MAGTRRRASTYNRSHGKVIHGIATNAMPKPKRSANNMCDNPACGHFRSDHRYSRECRVDGCGCGCESMVW